MVNIIYFLKDTILLLSFKALLLIYLLIFRNYSKKEIWLFGAWKGRLYADNSKYLYEHIISHVPNVIPFWCTTNNEVYKQLKSEKKAVVKIGTFKHLLLFLSSKVVCFTHSQHDLYSGGRFLYERIANKLLISKFNVNLWHGMPIKAKVGHVPKLGSLGTADMFFASSELFHGVIRSYLPNDKYPIVITGEPRYDCFNQLPSKSNFFENFCIKEDEPVITYLPTWRYPQEIADELNNQILSIIQSESIHGILSSFNAHIIIKAHHLNLYLKQILTQNDSKNNNIHYISDVDDLETEKMLGLTDVLITDYSSCYVDYLLLNRPTIFYCHDLVEYERQAGFNFDFKRITAGPIVTNADQLANALKESIVTPKKFEEKREEICDQFHKYADFNFSRRAYEEIQRTRNTVRESCFLKN